LLSGTHYVALNSDFLNNLLSCHTLIIQKEKLDILTVDTAFCFPVLTMEIQKGKIVEVNIYAAYFLFLSVRIRGKVLRELQTGF